MSKLFVDEIVHQSSQGSGTITIGASGETINVVGTLQNNGSAVGGTSQIVFLTSSTAQTIPDEVVTVITIDYSETLKIGSSMTYSSGVWTFPETGIYKINFSADITNYPSGGGDVSFFQYTLQNTTDNGSNWNDLARTYTQIVNLRSGDPSPSCNFALFDVTNTSTHKVRFKAYKIDTTSTDTYLQNALLIFEKIANT